MKTFKDITNEAQSLDDIKIVPLPAGEYEFRIKSINQEAKLRGDFGDTPEGTEYVEIYLTPVRALDVDEEELDQCSDWENKLMSLSLITASDITKLVDIANERGLVYNVGLDMNDYATDEGPDFDQLFKDLTNKHVGGQVTHYVSKAGNAGASIKRTFPLD